MVTKRKNKGQFQPGLSGNPDGRPKGSKNQITLLKDSLEIALRERSEPSMVKVLDTAIALALEGDRSMIKLLLELHMSKGVTDVGGKATEKVSITINGPTETKKEATPGDPVLEVSPANPVLN